MFKQLNILSIIILGSIKPLSRAEQIFMYRINDTITVQFQQKVDLSAELVLSDAEYAGEGELQLNHQFQQNKNTMHSVKYNVLYFNVTNESGLFCYQNYLNSNENPIQQLECSKNSNNSNNRINLNSLSDECLKLLDCENQTFQFSTKFSDMGKKDNYKIAETIIFIENSGSYNTNNFSLNLVTITDVHVYVYYNLFYWTIVSTILVVLFSILSTGSVIYLLRKYKRVKRLLQELRLTEVDEEKSAIRNSFKSRNQ